MTVDSQCFGHLTVVDNCFLIIFRYLTEAICFNKRTRGSVLFAYCVPIIMLGNKATLVPYSKPTNTGNVHVTLNMLYGELKLVVRIATLLPWTATYSVNLAA